MVTIRRRCCRALLGDRRASASQVGLQSGSVALVPSDSECFVLCANFDDNGLTAVRRATKPGIDVYLFYFYFIFYGVGVRRLE